MSPSIDSASISFGSTVSDAPVDPMNVLKQRLESDKYPGIVDLGAGVYRDEEGRYYEFEVIKKAKKILESQNLGHDYQMTVGIASFVSEAAKLLLGAESQRLAKGHNSSCQTIGGTGANRIGAVYLTQQLSKKSSGQPGCTVYVGTPAWGNYKPLFSHAGFAVKEYVHYDTTARRIDFDSIRTTMQNALPQSVFVLQGCGHNPSGADLSKEQWKELAQLMKERELIPFFDVAYPGFASEDHVEDLWGVRYFADQGFEMIVIPQFQCLSDSDARQADANQAAQSFSKCFGLYAERVGCVHVLSKSNEVAKKVTDQLRSLIRWEFSSSPAFGARLVSIILNDAQLKAEWQEELKSCATRILSNRQALHKALEACGEMPGQWDHILEERGLFSLLGVTPPQFEKLISDYHIYLSPNGRVNFAGLSSAHVQTIAKAITKVQKETQQNGK